MSRIVRRPEAKTDLKEIWKYIAAQDKERASNFLKVLDEALQSLAQHPFMGKERPEIMEEIRSFPVKSYVIFYRPLDNGIEVVRILHGARDIEALFE
ncbi:plasmid stabilization system protein [Calothrix sp. NIES-4071]|nr:plasmid stabilization system protein [Calothrix sp. NIES-4071]BAZ58519.1 plasmid stabilization system protein [Calothrix sp. NIES-4105]